MDRSHSTLQTRIWMWERFRAVFGHSNGESMLSSKQFPVMFPLQGKSLIHGFIVAHGTIPSLQCLLLPRQLTEKCASQSLKWTLLKPCHLPNPSQSKPLPVSIFPHPCCFSCLSIKYISCISHHPNFLWTNNNTEIQTKFTLLFDDQTYHTKRSISTQAISIQLIVFC